MCTRVDPQSIKLAQRQLEKKKKILVEIVYETFSFIIIVKSSFNILFRIFAILFIIEKWTIIMAHIFFVGFIIKVNLGSYLYWEVFCVFL